MQQTRAESVLSYLSNGVCDLFVGYIVFEIIEENVGTFSPIFDANYTQ